jgi:hypothetical protein
VELLGCWDTLSFLVESSFMVVSVFDTTTSRKVRSRIVAVFLVVGVQSETKLNGICCKVEKYHRLRKKGEQVVIKANAKAQREVRGQFWFEG